MNRRERIVVLLDNFVDVENGLYDAKGEGANVHMMCAAWNFPKQGYPALVGLLRIMKKSRSTLYWHVAENYIRFQGSKLALQCPRCLGVLDSWSSINFHKHEQQNVAVSARIIRNIHPDVKPRLLQCIPKPNGETCGECAVCWLDKHWPDPGPFLPDELKKEPKDKDKKAVAA